MKRFSSLSNICSNFYRIEFFGIKIRHFQINGPVIGMIKNILKTFLFKVRRLVPLKKKIYEITNKKAKWAFAHLLCLLTQN